MKAKGEVSLEKIYKICEKCALKSKMFNNKPLSVPLTWKTMVKKCKCLTECGVHVVGAVFWN